MEPTIGELKQHVQALQSALAKKHSELMEHQTQLNELQQQLSLQFARNTKLLNEIEWHKQHRQELFKAFGEFSKAINQQYKSAL